MFDPDRSISPKHFSRNPEFKDLLGLRNQATTEAHHADQGMECSSLMVIRGESDCPSNIYPFLRIVDDLSLPKSIRRWVSRLVHVVYRVLMGARDGDVGDHLRGGEVAILCIHADCLDGFHFL